MLVDWTVHFLLLIKEVKKEEFNLVNAHTPAER